ncbi:sugar phosphate isomerase/epimerase [Muricomes sp. OA1]|uniref:Sugar phosphate isomerase/epimerase n=1 Tax=Hungatella hathewayi TaxID=154046 RepID=A0A3E2WX85_9FIRM|nr:MULTISPECIES: sugar phosphate isomerase/epimerase [Clostridia]MCH1971403.1 sugar phosphate isomerase/epimerase [Muricomes sp. OA1]RGC32665.1 sugar phosphate isomerase/epimerase [Hungatella hathewayi]GKH34699.1 hypothetical protein CE91St64_41060 [Faecalicatena contorta]
MKISLMTINMILPAYFKYIITGDRDEFKDTYEEMLDLVKESGYSAVDVWGEEVKAFGMDYVRRELDKRGIEVSSFIYMDEYANPDKDMNDALYKRGCEAVEMAEELGTGVLMLVPQAHKGIENEKPEDIREHLAARFAPIADQAVKYGIHPVVEDTPDLKLHFCTAAELEDVFSKAPQLELVFDSGNMLLVKEDPTDYYEKFADRTAHIHLKDMRVASDKEMFADTCADGSRMAGAATGTGMVDFKALMGCFKRHGYDGFLTVEFVYDNGDDYKESLIRGRKYVEDLL